MRTVCFDIDTQNDFVLPAGALYAPGAETILLSVAALNRAAAQRGWPVVSTMDAHTESDSEFRQWPGHCIAGTLGQRKPEATLLARRVIVPSNVTVLRTEGFEQILLEKQHLDCFTNLNLAGLLEALAADRYVVYGVVTEYCVKFAAFGLLATGKRVEIVEDAVRALNTDDARAVLEEFRGRGGVLTESSAILSVK